MSTVDFKQLLSKPLDDVKKPPPLPAGTYFGAITKWEFGESPEKKTPYVRFFFLLQSPGPDIDVNELTGVDLAKRSPRKDFYITPDAEWRLKEFIESAGASTAGRSFASAIPDLQNRPVIIEVTQRSSKDGKDIYNDVGEVKGQD